MQAGVIGLGAMGSGIAANLAAAGRLAAVWNRTHAKAAAFAQAHGVSAAADPAALAAAVDVVVISVAADDDLLEVVAALCPQLGPGQVVVDTSTVAAATARAAAAQIHRTGAEFLDAPVSGGPEGARNAALVMMVGGSREVLERLRPLLATISAAAHHMGPIGAGQATKAVNQITVAGVVQGIAAALAYGAQEGLDLDTVIEVVSAGAAGNWQLTHRGPNMVRERFTPGFKLALHRKDLAIVRETLAAQGWSCGLIEATIADYDELIARGCGAQDITALYRLRREAFASDY